MIGVEAVGLSPLIGYFAARTLAGLPGFARCGVCIAIAIDD
jgi:hypothetical protein